MGGLLKLLFRFLKSAPKKAAKPPAKPRSGKAKANDSGSDAKKRDECVGDCNRTNKKNEQQKRSYSESLKGKKFEDAEKRLDDELVKDKGWQKQPTKKGDGIRYTDGKGNAVMLEKGWKNADDPLHSGPYIRESSGGNITRTPLEGNPTLNSRGN